MHVFVCVCGYCQVFDFGVECYVFGKTLCYLNVLQNQ